jgi:hypothetical protein
MREKTVINERLEHKLQQVCIFIVVISEIIQRSIMEYILQKLSNGMYGILLDKAVALKGMDENTKRVLCSINGHPPFHCAIMPQKEGGHFIVVGLRVCKQLQLKVGSKIDVVFSEDKTEYQFEMPEELAEVLRTDPEADKLFHSLTKGNQRGLIYLVMQVKSSQKRIERALKITDKLKAGITSPRLMLK